MLHKRQTGRNRKELADEVLIINLPERTDRRIRLEELLAEQGVAYKFMTGFRVRFAEIEKREISEFRWEPFKVVAGWESYVEASIGCKRAHLNCLEYGLNAKLQTMLIMEDDVAFHPDWYRRYIAALDELPPGWLQLYLSAWEFQPSERFTQNVKRLSGACQTTAILYSAKGMEAAMKCVRAARTELDWWMGQHLHPYGCSYVMDPHATFQTGGFSDCRSQIREVSP